MICRVLLLAFLGAALVPTSARTVQAASHQWKFHELFSNADGTIQFIEMKEAHGDEAEHELAGKWVRADNADNQVNFRRDLTGNTANKHLLLATQAFADLPGARPTPIEINPEDAAKRDINDGDLVKVFNQRGGCRARAHISTDIRAGVVSLPTGA